MRIEVVEDHRDCHLGDGRMSQRIETFDVGGILPDGCPLVLGYQHELWKEMAKQAARILAVVIGSGEHGLSEAMLEDAVKLKHCINNETPEQIDWIVAAARKTIGVGEEDE